MSDQQAIRHISIKKVALSSFLLLATALFIALGIWQIERLGWKQALIARVDARVHAEPVDAPSPPQWPSVNRDADEYRHIKASGIYEHDKETLVYAATELGAGYWVMTPSRPTMEPC